MKQLSYDEYQNRIKNINTPEEAAAFAQELLAPMITGLKERTKEAEAEAKADEEGDVPEEVEHKGKPGPKPKLVPGDLRRSGTGLTPWYEMVANDTENMVVSLYAKGLTTRDISLYLKSQHGIELSQPSISAITDKVYPMVKEWQVRPLASCYPILYLDGLHFKVRDSGKISPKFAYVALGINLYGKKEVLGIWVGESEGAKFWLHVLNELKNRGVEDILIACVDGLKGFPEAIQAIFPSTEVQVCIAHQIRHTFMFVPHKDRDRFCQDLKAVYTAPSEEAGREALQGMMDKWPQYRSCLNSWETRWKDLAPFFNYPEPIRRMMYTTNAIESLNHQFRKVTKTTTIFPHDDALLKLLWLAQADKTQTWTPPLRGWPEAMAQFSILFPDRVQL